MTAVWQLIMPARRYQGPGYGKSKENAAVIVTDKSKCEKRL